MRLSRTLLLCAILGLSACAGEEAVKPEAGAAAESAKGAETRGIDQKAPEGVTGAEAGKATAEEAAPSADRLVHFAFDSATIDDAARAVIEANAKYLKSNPRLKVTLEGHTDERGTREYNLALGERRAKSVERVLKVLGIAADRISTVSYGEEKPIASGSNESAWGQNRRVQFVIK